jgi:hypothetical protein
VTLVVGGEDTARMAVLPKPVKAQAHLNPVELGIPNAQIGIRDV